MSKRALLVAGAAVAVGAVALFAVLLAQPGQKGATALFSQVVALYPGDDVRLLGVPIGKVDTVTPRDGQVRVGLRYDADAPVPSDAKAAIVAPSLVAGRYVELTPARVTGPRLADGATLGLDRTAVPVEFDQIKEQLDQLARALGPDGVNSTGALSQFLRVTAADLAGNGASINQTIQNLARALGTVSDNRGDLFTTVRNLETLAAALSGADSQVNQFTGQLADFSQVLAENSDDLGQALDTVDSSVEHLGAFVRAHRDRLGDNLDTLDRVARTVADNRQALADLLQKAPTALDNLNSAYDAFSGSLSGALSLTQFQDLAEVACSGVTSQRGGSPLCKSNFGPPLRPLAMDYPPLSMNLIQRNGWRNSITADQGAAPDPSPTVRGPYDPLVTPPKPHLGSGTRPTGGR
jgi:phospholipid/cholesterol/gamma-HCH transport system substrate-binding protein